MARFYNLLKNITLYYYGGMLMIINALTVFGFHMLAFSLQQAYVESLCRLLKAER